MLTLKLITNQPGIVKRVSSITYLHCENHTHAVSTMRISWFPRLPDQTRGGGCLTNQTSRSLRNRQFTAWTILAWGSLKPTMTVDCARSCCGLIPLISLGSVVPPAFRVTNLERPGDCTVL